MPQNLGVHGAAFFEGIREDGEAGVLQGAIRPGTFLVGRPGEFDDAAVVPGQRGRPDGRRNAERIAEKAAEEVGMLHRFGPADGIRTAGRHVEGGDDLTRGRGGLAGVRAAGPSHRPGTEAQGGGTVVPEGVSRGSPEVLGTRLSVGEPLSNFDRFLHRIRPPEVQQTATAGHGEQPELAVAGPARLPQVVEQQGRIGAGEPLLFVHGRYLISCRGWHRRRGSTTSLFER
jgi:hypothetical protein